MLSNAGESRGSIAVAMKQLCELKNLTVHPQLQQDLSKLREKPSGFWHSVPQPPQDLVKLREKSVFWDQVLQAPPRREHPARLAFDKIQENNATSYAFSSTV